MGTAGWARFTVQPASDASCLGALGSSSIPGTPPSLFAVFVARDGSSTSNGLNVGIIVGAAVGGLVGVLALITCGILSYYCLRRDGQRTPRRLKKRTPGQNLSGINTPPMSSRGRNISSTGREALSYYNPEPFSSRPSTGDLSQTSVRHANMRQGYPGAMPAPSAPIMQPPMPRYANTSRSGVPSSSASDASYSQFGSRYAPQQYQPPFSMYGPSELQEKDSFASVNSGSAKGAVEPSSQFEPRYAPQRYQPPSSSMYGGTIPSEGLHQKGSFASVTSGSAKGAAETSSQAGSGNGGAPSMTSRSSYPILSRPVGGSSGGGLLKDPSEPLPAYPVAGLPPRNDFKLKVANP